MLVKPVRCEACVRTSARRITFQGRVRSSSKSKTASSLGAETMHLIVKVRGEDGKRLNPSKEDVQRWRETYSEALSDNGIDAIATRRLQQLTLELGESQAVRQIRDSGRKLEKIGKTRADRFAS